MDATRVLGIVGMVGVGWMVLALVAMHVTQPELNPIEQWLSNYVHGTGGWAVRAGFFTAGVALLAIALGLRRSLVPARRREVAVAILAVAAIAFAVLGLFSAAPPPFDVAPEDDLGVAIHESAAGILFLGVTAAAFVLIGALRRDARWAASAAITRLAAWVMLASMLGLFAAAALAPTETGVGGVTGLVQRILVATLLAWLLLLGWRTYRLAPLPAVQQPGAGAAHA